MLNKVIIMMTFSFPKSCEFQSESEVQNLALYNKCGKSCSCAIQIQLF